MKVAFVGLGVMGFPMAGHLAKAGHEMAVFNRTPGEGRSAGSRRTAAGPARRVGRGGRRAPRSSSLCVGNDDDVRQVVGRGPAGHGGRAAVVVDHTTTSAMVAREMAELAARERAARSSTRRSPAARRAPRTAS